MNRVITAIQKMEEQIKGRVESGAVTLAKVEDCRKSLDMDLEEYSHFQNLKSAYTGPKLTLEEATTIYGYLGNTPDHFNGQSCAVKFVLTQIFGELMKVRMPRMAV